MAIVLAGIRVIAPYPERRRTGAEGGLPARADRCFIRPGRVVEQADVRGAGDAIQFRGEAVTGEMNYPPPAFGDGSDPFIDLGPEGPIVVFDDALPHFGRGGVRGRGEQARMAQRAIQIDEQPAGGGGEQRGLEPRRDFAGHRQRAGVVAAMTIQPGSILGAGKQRAIGRGNLIAAVLAGDQKVIAHVLSRSGVRLPATFDFTSGVPAAG